MKILRYLLAYFAGVLLISSAVTLSELPYPLDSSYNPAKGILESRIETLKYLYPGNLYKAALFLIPIIVLVYAAQTFYRRRTVDRKFYYKLPLVAVAAAVLAILIGRLTVDVLFVCEELSCIDLMAYLYYQYVFWYLPGFASIALLIAWLINTALKKPRLANFFSSIPRHRVVTVIAVIAVFLIYSSLLVTDNFSCGSTPLKNLRISFSELGDNTNCIVKKAQASNNVNFCEKSTDREYCYELLAQERTDPKLCEKTKADAGEAGVCFGSLGIKLGDVSLCDKAAEAEKPFIATFDDYEDFLPGVGGWADECYLQIAKKQNNPVLCDRMILSYDAATCYLEFSKQDPSLCNKIDKEPIIADTCYQKAAKNDPTLCEKMKDPSHRGQCLGGNYLEYMP